MRSAITWGPRVKKILGSPLQRISLTVLILAMIAGPSLYISFDNIYNNAPAEYSYTSVLVNDSVPFVPQNYYRPWDQDFNYSVLIDVHNHPTGMDPETVIKWHIASGYNAVVITEHNDVSSGQQVQKVAREKYNDQIKVLVGEEWTNCRMHMGMLGLKELIPVPKTPTDEEIQNVINSVHAQGGLVVVNHIPWSYWAGLDSPSTEDLIAWGVDFFDVTTYERLDLQTIYYARSKGVGIVAGTDSHELGAAHAWTLLDVDPNNITEDSIMDALRSRKSSFVSDSIRRLTSFVDGYCGGERYEILYPQIRASILWLLLGWLMLELVWGGLKIAYYLVMNKIRPNRRKQRSEDEFATPLMDLWDK